MLQRWEMKIQGKEVCLNRVSNSLPPGHESDMITTEPSRLASVLSKLKELTMVAQMTEFVLDRKKWNKTLWAKEKMLVTSIFSFSHYVFNWTFFLGLININILWVKMKLWNKLSQFTLSQITNFILFQIEKQNLYSSKLKEFADINFKFENGRIFPNG